MTTIEKISNAKKRINELEILNNENAKKRIDELERLIKYWNDLDNDEAKIVNFTRSIENKLAQIVIIKAD